MNWRKPIYLNYAAWRGYRFPAWMAEYTREFHRGAGSDTALRGLTGLLRHCRQSVPYYARQLRQIGDARLEETDPIECLSRLPVLTKEIIRANAAELQSADLGHRKWSYNTSGGSTGEPVRLIQDREYEDRSKAIALFWHSLLGCDVGHPVIRLSGSERDLEGGKRSAKARFFAWLTNNTWLSTFNLSPERMREYVATFNRLQPGLVLAYVQVAYEFAQFVEREKLSVRPQRALVASAGALEPAMRETIARVFGCRVYNLFGSREVSLIGSEVPGVTGLWVPPWGNFVEILDDAGRPAPPGEEGNVVVTCLNNYAMPLVRYQIGDRGALAPEVAASSGRPAGQVLKYVSGRTVDVFRTRDQKVVDGEYFAHLLKLRPWIGKFQVVQKDYEHVQFRIVKTNGGPAPAELEEIAAKSRLVLGAQCRIDFEFPDELPPHPAGKYRYTISEIAA